MALALYAEEFPAPDRAVESVSGAIPGNAEVRTFHMILCGTCGDMGLMMLHPNYRQPRFLRPMRGSIVGVQIADHRLRLEAVQPAQIGDGFFEALACLECFQVANVLAEEDVAPDRDGHRIFQVPADREHGRK